MILFFYS